MWWQLTLAQQVAIHGRNTLHGAEPASVVRHPPTNERSQFLGDRDLLGAPPGESDAQVSDWMAWPFDASTRGLAAPHGAFEQAPTKDFVKRRQGTQELIDTLLDSLRCVFGHVFQSYN